MNLRISENQLRFRITQSETELLTLNGVLAFSLDLGVQALEYAVVLSELGQPLALEVQRDEWKLLVDRAEFNQLIASLPSCEGIEHEVQSGTASITLVLEVDVRRKR